MVDCSYLMPLFTVLRVEFFNGVWVQKTSYETEKI